MSNNQYKRYEVAKRRLYALKLSPALYEAIVKILADALGI